MDNLTIWFDGSCPLCRREIALMKGLDRRGALHFIDAADAGVADCPTDKVELLARLHACEDGVLLTGASAFAPMWRAVPLLRPLGLLAQVPFVLNWLERAYKGFLRVRPKLQRLAHSRARA